MRSNLPPPTLFSRLVPSLSQASPPLPAHHLSLNTQTAGVGRLPTIESRPTSQTRSLRLPSSGNYRLSHIRPAEEEPILSIHFRSYSANSTYCNVSFVSLSLVPVLQSSIIISLVSDLHSQAPLNPSPHSTSPRTPPSPSIRNSESLCGHAKQMTPMNNQF